MKKKTKPAGKKAKASSPPAKKTIAVNGKWEGRDLTKLKAEFLEAFMACGRVDLATKKIAVNYQSPYFWAKEDPEFEAGWEEARKVAAQLVEDAAMRRAVQGVLKPIYQRGVLVGMERYWSDSLTIVMLKALKPEKYKDRVDHEHAGKDGGPIQHSVGLSDEAAEQIKRKVLGVDKG